jgi:RNA polymerase sigma-70 factor (ECF subfamily)
MNKKNLSDLDLINEYLNGNQSALEALINRHHKKLFSYILMLVKDKELAEDIFQDTFYKVILTLKSGNYKEEGKFLSWIMRIAHNLVIDFFRKDKKIPVVENNEEYDIFNTIKIYDESYEEKIIKEQIDNDVKRLIDYLPEEQKEVLIMRHYKELSFKEIADLTNVSINTALGRMRYALINMRKIIDEKQIVLST